MNSVPVYSVVVMRTAVMVSVCDFETCFRKTLEQGALVAVDEEHH